MKTLILLRHAKSGWDDGVARDFDRGLNAKGMRAARTVGRRLRDDAVRPEALFASPARRVRETLEGVWAGYGTRLPVTFEKRLYLAPVDLLIELVRHAPPEAGTVLVAGHNPGLEELVLALVPHDPADRLRDDVEEKFPTASVATIALDIGDWMEAAPGRGRLVRFVRPRDLDPALGPDAG